MPHLQKLDTIQHVYLIGIGGTAMASLAGMLKERGYTVSGSDEHVYPPMSTFLEQLGIEVLEGYTAEHLETLRPDLVVVGNAAARTNPEAACVIEKDLPYTSMPEAIYELFIAGKHSVVITGTHGKTTTTSLMAWLLESAGRDPGMVVGGIPVNFGSNYKLGGGQHFVIEGDEYNTAFFDKGPKFLHYHANTLILNNIEWDHADIFPDLESIVSAFRQVVREVAADDVIIANGDDARVATLRSEAHARWITFGTGDTCAVRASNIELGERASTFTVHWEGDEWGRFGSPLSGRHNVLNALADIVAARLLGLQKEEIQRGLDTFQGIRRRMEVRGIERTVTVIDDFAHHPTAVATTLHGARRRYPGRKIWGVFEPRSISSSRKEFEQAYLEAFHEADRVVVGPIYYKDRYLTRYGIENMMSIDWIVEHLRRDEIEADWIEDIDAIAARIAEEAGEGDVVLVMSSGSFGGLHEKILQALRKE